MRKIILLIVSCFSHTVIKAQEPNYDESKVPQYTLSDPLKMEDGQRVKNQTEWMNERRGEILTLRFTI